MSRYIVLVNFTEKGAASVKESPARAEAFRAAAGRLGATVESVFWTLGPHDGVIVLSAPDEATAAAVGLQLSKAGNVRTCMLRAFDETEFKGVVAKVS